MRQCQEGRRFTCGDGDTPTVALPLAKSGTPLPINPPNDIRHRLGAQAGVTAGRFCCWPTGGAVLFRPFRSSRWSLRAASGASGLLLFTDPRPAGRERALSFIHKGL